MSNQKQQRRAGALIRLENQLKAGTKTEKKTNKQIPLTDSDIKRINKEIVILKS